MSLLFKRRFYARNSKKHTSICCTLEVIKCNRNITNSSQNHHGQKKTPLIFSRPFYTDWLDFWPASKTLIAVNDVLFWGGTWFFGGDDGAWRGERRTAPDIEAHPHYLVSFLVSRRQRRFLKYRNRRCSGRCDAAPDIHTRTITECRKNNAYRNRDFFKCFSVFSRRCWLAQTIDSLLNVAESPPVIGSNARFYCEYCKIVSDWLWRHILAIML